MRNVVVTQEIRTTWTKVSRGDASAGKRNAVPEIARIPVQRIAADNLVLVYHHLSFGESDQFAQSTEEVQINPVPRPLVIGCICVDHSEEEASVTFHWDYRCGGAPDRSWARKTLHLAANEWGQMVYNGRHQYSSNGQWWYEKRVVNVGLFERLIPGMFTKQAPTCRFSAMADLF